MGKSIAEFARPAEMAGRGRCAICGGWEGGRDKRAASAGCSVGALRSTDQRVRKPRPASFAARPAGTKGISPSYSNNLGASIGCRTARRRPMSGRDDELRVRSGRVRDVEVSEQVSLRASWARSCVPPARLGIPAQGSVVARRVEAGGFGRGRVAAAALALRSPQRRVVIKARVVRQRGGALSLGSARQASELSAARRRNPGRHGHSPFRCERRHRRRLGLRRALRGRSAPFPLHHIAGGRARDGRPACVHPAN